MNKLWSLLGIFFVASASGVFAHVHSIEIMKHLCDPSIQSEADLLALEANLTPVEAYGAREYNCPATALVGDDPPAGALSSPRMSFQFTVNESDGEMNDLDDALYDMHALCETDVSFDFDGDGNVSATSCVDVSDYEFGGITAEGIITVTETAAPAGYRYGAVRFTPTEFETNNDADTLVSAANGVIMLDPTVDSDDEIVLHVYNFQDVPPIPEFSSGLIGVAVVGMLGAAAVVLRKR